MRYMLIIIVGLITILVLVALAIEYWLFFFFVVGIALVNVFTLWATIAIFVVGIGVQVYDHIQKNTLTASIVIVALIINAIFQAIGSSNGGDVPCGRATS